MPLQGINRENWLSLTNEFRRNFDWEQQFRTFYVDYLLHAISDRRTIYKECRCQRSDIADSFMDNVIFIGRKYLPVEVKLSVAAEQDILGQVQKYCHDDRIFLSKDKIIPGSSTYDGKVLVIDTMNIYLYSYGENCL